MGMIKVLLGPNETFTGLKDVTERVHPGSVLINQSLRLGASSASCDLHFRSSDWNWPKLGNVLEIRNYYDSIGEATGIEITADELGAYLLEFSGPVQRIRMKWLSAPDEFVISVEASDWKRFFDRMLVKEFPDNVTMVDEIIDHILENYCEGFIRWSDIPVMEPARFPSPDYREPSSIIEELANQFGYVWYVDYFKRLHFVPKFAYRTPLTDNIYAPEYADLERTGGLTLEEDMRNLRNVIYTTRGTYIKGPEKVIQEWTNPGNIFHLPKPLFPLTTAERELLDEFITVERTNKAGIVYTMSLYFDEIDGMPGDGNADWYACFINFDKNYLRLGDYVPLESGEKLRIEYYPAEEQPQYFFRKESQEVLQYAELSEGYYKEDAAIIRKFKPSPGWYEYLLDPPAALYSVDGSGIAAWAFRYLDKYAFPILRGTLRSRLSGWRAGQHFRLVSYLFREWGGLLDEKMLVTNVRKRLSSPGEMSYDISFESWEWKGT